MSYLFVYGSFRPGGEHQDRMRMFPFLGQCTILGYKLSEVTDPSAPDGPSRAAIHTGKAADRLRGYLYDVPEAYLRDLDVFEAPNYTRREALTAGTDVSTTGAVPHRVWVYAWEPVARATTERMASETAIVDFSRDRMWHDVVYQDPTPAALTRLKKFLHDNPEQVVRLYHGTDAAHPVLRQGLLPTSASRRRSLQSSAGYVYLSVYPGMAETFGKMAYPGSPIAVYAVDLPVRALLPDMDQLRNKRYYSGTEGGHNAMVHIGSTLADSIAWGHGARVRGAIPPSAISLLTRGTTHGATETLPAYPAPHGHPGAGGGDPSLEPGHFEDPEVIAATTIAAQALDQYRMGVEPLGQGNFGVTYKVGDFIVKLPAPYNVHGQDWEPAAIRTWLLHEAGIANQARKTAPPHVASYLPRIVYTEPSGTPALVREYGEPIVGRVTA